MLRRSARFSMPSWYAGNIPWLLASRALRSFSQALLVVAVPLYVALAGYSATDVGYLLSISLVGSTGITLAVGVLADRYGRKPFLVAIALLSAVGAAVYALTTRFWLIAVMAVLAPVRGGGAGSGGGFGPFYPAEQALVASGSADRERNSIFSSLSLVGVLAGAAGSLVAGLPHVLQRWLGMSALDAYRPVFWIASLSGLATMLIVLPIREQVSRPQAKQRAATAATVRLLGRLWVTNGLNGLVMGVFGPFLTYWLSIRYGIGAGEIATLYTVANLLTALSYLEAPRIARRLGAVPTIVIARSATVVFAGGLALAPTFLLASLLYTVRVMVNSVGMPIRQSFVMGISAEEYRSEIAAMGNLPAQAIGAVAPSIASQLMQNVSEAAPVWLAAAATAVNALLFGLLFRRQKPPEEDAAAGGSG